MRGEITLPFQFLSQFQYGELRMVAFILKYIKMMYLKN